MWRVRSHPRCRISAPSRPQAGLPRKLRPGCDLEGRGGHRGVLGSWRPLPLLARVYSSPEGLATAELGFPCPQRGHLPGTPLLGCAGSSSSLLLHCFPFLKALPSGGVNISGTQLVRTEFLYLPSCGNFGLKISLSHTQGN